MKKLVIIIAAITSLVTNSYAQNNETNLREKLTFGLKVGINYSNVYDEKGDDFVANPKLGMAAGAYLAIPIGKYFGIQPEILISQKGFQATGKILGENYNYTRTSTYMDIPLLFAFKPSEFISLVAGPQYSYLLKQSDVFKNASTSIIQETEFKNDNIRKNVLCFTGGIDINIRHIVLGTRAGWDMQNNNGDGTATTPRYKNVWYQGTVAYRFYRK